MRSEDYIPQLGGDAEAGILATEVVLIVVALQPSEVSLGFSSMVQRIMNQIVADITVEQTYPKDYAKVLVTRKYQWVDRIVAEADEDGCKDGRENKSVSALKIDLRVDWQHVVNAVQYEVDVSDDAVVEEIILGVEEEAV